MHSNDAGHVHLARARKALIAHHAHHRAWHNAEKLFERGPTLDGADSYLRLAHPAINHRAQLCHFHKRRFRDTVRLHVLPDRAKPLCHFLVVVLEPPNPPQHLREVQRLHRDSRRLENLFAVAHRVEGRRAGAHRADPQFPESFRHPAHGKEPVQILAKDFRIRGFRV